MSVEYFDGGPRPGTVKRGSKFKLIAVPHNTHSV